VKPEMKKMKNFLPISVWFLFATVIISHQICLAQVDTEASEKTKTLYGNLKVVQNSAQFLFGQEFFNSFRFSSGSAHGEKEFSDSKAITGSHPAVLGSDFHYYLEKDPTERAYHTEAVKWAYEQGYVITFDWHISARGTNSYSYTAALANLVSNIVGDLNGDRDWLYGELDKVIEIINEDLVVNGEPIPIVFRPWHEMNGNWFWWGSSGATPANYKALYALTVDYIKERTSSVLFCWSPNTPFNLDRYPGDQYVDVVGVDAYEVDATTLRAQVGAVVDYAQAHDKVAVFSETGDRNSDANSPSYWKNVVLPGIVEDPSGKAQKIAWVLTWINASWSEPYVAHSGSSQSVKQSFIDFKNSPQALFGDEMPDMYSPLPIPVVVGVEDNVRGNIGVQFYPVPAKDELTIQMTGFESIFTIAIYDMQGRLIRQRRGSDKEVKLVAHEIPHPGMYILQISDSRKAINKKLLIE
jgi:hypothetical protein